MTTPTNRQARHFVWLSVSEDLHFRVLVKKDDKGIRIVSLLLCRIQLNWYLIRIVNHNIQKEGYHFALRLPYKAPQHPYIQMPHIAILSNIFRTPFPLFPPSSKSSTSFRARSDSVLSTFRQYSKLPVDSIYDTAYFLTCSSSGFCLRMFRRTRFSGLVRMLWMMGKENLPSVKSSQRPLFCEYSGEERFW